MVYSLNSRTAIDNRRDLILLDPAQFLRLREGQPVEAESAIVVEAKIAAGFVVLRVLTPDSSFTGKSNSFLQAVGCKHYLPGGTPDTPTSGINR